MNNQSNQSIIQAYNLLCENLYITSAVAVIEEAFTMVKSSPEVRKMMMERDPQFRFDEVEREQREFLMEFLRDSDGIVLTEAYSQFSTNLEAFRKTAFERSVLRGLQLRGELPDD